MANAGDATPIVPAASQRGPATALGGIDEIGEPAAEGSAAGEAVAVDAGGLVGVPLGKAAAHAETSIRDAARGAIHRNPTAPFRAGISGHHMLAPPFASPDPRALVASHGTHRSVAASPTGRSQLPHWSSDAAYPPARRTDPSARRSAVPPARGDGSDDTFVQVSDAGS